MKNRLSRHLLLLCVGIGGVAALGWETIWLIKTALAIGVSSQATAVVISATMGGMALGTAVAGVVLQRHANRCNPFLVYAVIELFIGLCGFFVLREFEVVARLDEFVFSAYGSNSALVHVLLIAMTLGPPSMAMGASIPVLGLVAKQTECSLGILYGVNTLGAAFGTLFIAFVVLPLTGISTACSLLAAVNAGVAGALFWFSRGAGTRSVEVEKTQPGRIYHSGWYSVAFLSGFSIFALEVVFFRAMRAAFLSTSYSFAVMLGSVLLALAAGAYSAKLLRKDRATASLVLGVGGALVFGITPLVERLDALTSFYLINPHLSNFLLSIGVIGPVVTVLGIVFPLLLDWSKSPLEWGLLHASNTIGAIVGAIGAAWILLPMFGLAQTSWLVAVLLVGAGILAAKESATRLRVGLAGAAIFLLAFFGQSGIGKTRIVGQRGQLNSTQGYNIVAYKETADFTVSVVEIGDSRALFIDGFDASPDPGQVGALSYMTWMGRLPMLLHADPQDALVICFGRGETANAVRLEDPQSLDIVDISEAVFDMAPLFDANGDVLADPRVRPIVMDGRSWLRRTQKQYDVITLEPMPPTFSGMNALYSLEFYQLAHHRLRAGGTIAQWVPYHLITPDQASAISRTFIEVFPDAILWIYPQYRTGILVGRKSSEPGMQWHGLARQAPGRELDARQIKDSVQLDAAGLKRYAGTAVTIRDDNQYLAYGFDSGRHDFGPALGMKYEQNSLARIEEASNGQ